MQDAKLSKRIVYALACVGSGALVLCALFSTFASPAPPPLSTLDTGETPMTSIQQKLVLVSRRQAVRRLLLTLAFLGSGFIVTFAYFLTPASPAQTPPPPLASLEWQIPFVTETANPAVATPTPDTRNVKRIEIPSVSIDASITALGLDAQGHMLSPNGPKDVAWYNFSSKPGTPGNVVMSAHVDYIDYGPAVFWRLRDLKPGDEIKVTMDDGSSFLYAVASLNYYDAESAPVNEIVGKTPMQSITLITCGGVFDKSVREYNQRLVVRGIRVTQSTNPGL